MDRKIFYVLGIITIALLSVKNLQAQKECTVIDTMLQGNYDGRCKRGMAHGYGVAEGKCKYEGYFKKGKKEKEGKYYFQDGGVYEGEFEDDMMHGKGKLTDSNGQVISGYWKFGEYVGEERERFIGYKIYTKANVEPRISKVGDAPNINWDVRSTYVQGEIIPRIVEYTSGTIANSGDLINVSFPVKVKIEYQVPNKTNTFNVNVILEFEIYEKGQWKITCEH